MRADREEPARKGIRVDEPTAEHPWITLGPRDIDGPSPAEPPHSDDDFVSGLPRGVEADPGFRSHDVARDDSPRQATEPGLRE